MTTANAGPAHFSARAIAEQNEHGRAEVVLRGITLRHRPADQNTGRIVIAAHRARTTPTRRHGRVSHRAIINLKTFRVIRWLDDPMPGLGWEMNDQNPLPWIHDDDLLTAQALAAGLATAPKTTGTLRFRGDDGYRQPISVTANLVLLDQHTTAALLTMSKSV